jgi:hypothetical protein
MGKQTEDQFLRAGSVAKISTIALSSGLCFGNASVNRAAVFSSPLIFARSKSLAFDRGH